MHVNLYNLHNSHAGPCISMRATDAQLICDEDGNFEPLQCRRMNDGTHTCRCVHPRNGSMVPNTMRTGIRERDETPDCESRGMYPIGYYFSSTHFFCYTMILASIS